MLLCFWYYVHVFWILSTDRPPLVAICVCACVFRLCFWCYVRRICHCFSRHATISCHKCVLCCLFEFFWSYVHLFWFGLADRPPSIAICVCEFLVSFCVWCCAHKFFDWLSKQATINCYMCRFLFGCAQCCMHTICWLVACGIDSLNDRLISWDQLKISAADLKR